MLGGMGEVMDMGSEAARIGAGSRPAGLDPGLVLAARERIAGHVRRTPLVRFPISERRVDLRLKLECLQIGGAFKARGAWNQIALLDERSRAAGVTTASSGNHGKALAWAAARAGIRARIHMPASAYSSKIEACRDYGAEVCLAPDRLAAEQASAEDERAGLVPIHPYDAEGTLAGAGTAALEVLEAWPEVDVLIVPVGGGGLLAGSALALAAAAGRAGAPRSGTRLVAAEPEGAPGLARALEAGEPVELARIESEIQGLTPPRAGRLNHRVAADALDRLVPLSDREILDAWGALVLLGGWTVEPAGAAAAAVVLGARLPEAWLAGRSQGDPLRVAAVVSGGNPEPSAIATLLAGQGP